MSFNDTPSGTPRSLPAARRTHHPALHGRTHRTPTPCTGHSHADPMEGRGDAHRYRGLPVVLAAVLRRLDDGAGVMS